MNARVIPAIHTALAAGGFFAAFMTGVLLHYEKLTTQSQGIGEWLPSALDVIGRYFPERAVFQLCAALAAWFHIAIVIIWYLLTRAPRDGPLRPSLPELVFAVGLVRTALLAGIIYIPKQDDHDSHDFCFAGYLLTTGIWFYGLCEGLGAGNAAKHLQEQEDDDEDDAEDAGLELNILPRHGSIKSREKQHQSHQRPSDHDDDDDDHKKHRRSMVAAGHRLRRQIAVAYALLFVPLGHYMMQQRVYGTPGAASKYALFEWLAILLDIAFDGVSVREFDGLELRVLAYPHHYRDGTDDDAADNDEDHDSEEAPLGGSVPREKRHYV